jgi:hypothetical protein
MVIFDHRSYLSILLVVGLFTDSSFGLNLPNFPSSIIDTISNRINIPSADKNKKGKFAGSNGNRLFSELETLIVTSKNGIDKSNQEEIKGLMVEIGRSLKVGDQRDAASGRWELIYTTEKEINFFKTSWPFAEVSSITQTLDVFDVQRVENCINFDGGGQFAVTGTVRAVDGGEDGYDRIAFEFTSATAVVWDRSISLPPTGSGWFDTMYCDDRYRLSRDSRGDWSVFRRID